MNKTMNNEERAREHIHCGKPRMTWEIGQGWLSH
jgi:hypothetical protein